MPFFDKTRHHIGIVRTDGSTEVGLMLVEQNGKPLYRTLTERYLKNQYYAGRPDYGAIDPQSELPIIQDDFRSGFGLYVADSNDPKRYYESYGMDLRHRGMAIAGPTPTTVTVPTIGISWATPTGASGWTNSANVKDDNEGTYAETNVVAGAWSGYLEITQTATNCEAVRLFKPRVVGSAEGAAIEIEIDVYYGGAWHNVYTGTFENIDVATGSWIAASLGGTQSVDKMQVKIKNLAGVARDIYIYEADFGNTTTSTGSVVAFAEFNSKLYGAKGDMLMSLRSAGAGEGAAYDHVFNFPATITSLEVHGSCLYIALGFSNAYWYMNTGGLFTQSNATNNKYQFFRTVHATSVTLYGNDGSYTIRSTTNPKNSSPTWTQKTIGSLYYAITDLITKAGALYIPKEDMLYYLDSSGNVQNDLAPRLQALTCSTSGKNALTDGDIIMYPAGDQGLLEIDGTTLTWRNPSSYCTNSSTFDGRVTALAYDEEYWFASVDNDPKAEISAGRLEDVDGETRFVWHPLAEITLQAGATIQKMFVSSIYQKRLWCASSNSADSLYYIPLTGYGNVTSDANRKFKTGTYFLTPYYHGDFKGENKAWIKLTLTMGHTFNAGRKFTVYYQILGSSEVLIGDFTGSATSMTQSRYIDVTNKPVSSMIRFRIIAVTDDPDYTPVLLSYDIRGILRPPAREIIECAVRCQDGIKDKKGLALEGTNAAYIRTVLDGARDATWPFTWYDLWGNTKYGIMLPADPESDVIAALKNENPEQYYFCRIQEVALS